MKSKNHWYTVLTALLLFAACDSDIDLFHEDQQKQYVVFGLLNSTDPLQQVKVRMTSVTDAALIDISADSTEFSSSPDLQVSIQEWQNNYYAVYPLTANRYAKDPGVFYNVRNDLFETRFTPYIEMTYKLIIKNPDNGDLVESKIVPVPAPKLGAPTWSWIRYNFSNEGDPFNIRFSEVPRVNVYLVRFTIRYIDVSEGGDTLLQSASWAFPPRYTDDPPEYSPTHQNLGNEHNQHITKAYAYRVFGQLISDRPGLSYRQLICFDISVWGGDQNLRNYTEFGIKFNDNRKQVFTNINNGIGFFGACSHADCTGILPDRNFMDSLPLDPKTSRLKFRTELYRPDALPKIQLSGFTSIIPEIRYE